MNVAVPSFSEPNQSTDVTFRHSGWQRNRSLIRTALIAADAPENRIRRFDACGSFAWLEENIQEPGKYRIRATCCRDRFCVPCGGEKAFNLAMNVQDATAGKTLRFITLTLAETDDPLETQLTHLRDSWKRLRSSSTWSGTQKGGIAFLEIKWRTSRQTWHPHLHLIVEGTYLDKGELSSAWRQATGNSFIIDIRLITDRSTAIRYVTKYATKPLNNSLYADAEKLVEAIQAMKGKRLVQTFGTWTKLELGSKPTSESWSPVEPLANTLHRASLGDQWSIDTLNSLRRHETCPTKTDQCSNMNKSPPGSQQRLTYAPTPCARVAANPCTRITGQYEMTSQSAVHAQKTKMH